VRTARRWIDYLDDADADISANTRPMNYPVQGGAADVMHRTMRLLFERYRDWPGNVLPVLTVHDEVLVEVDIAFADQVGALLADVMVEAFRTCCRTGRPGFWPFPASARPGQRQKQTVGSGKSARAVQFRYRASQRRGRFGGRIGPSRREASP